MDQRDTFDAVADLYGEVRPGYPAALYDDLWSLAGLGRDAVVLEVGCGAGQATGDLAARARRVTALDPGPNLIAQARARVTAANVDYVVARFEDVAPEPQAFDLVASAQAWHWVDRAVGFAKAAAALKAGGSLAVFGHVPNTPDGPLESAFKAAYDRFLPGAWGTPPSQAGYRPTGPFSSMYAASGLFEPAAHRAYTWTWRLDPQTLGRYLRTDSSYHPVPEATRFALFDALSEAVAAHGGVMDMPWETHLYVARKLSLP
jgi:SAM-dependent methyltransferase